jgi:hypothetical protein
MASPCTTDTQTLVLTEDATGHLQGDVQLEPLSEGGLEADANGIGLTLQSTGGLQHTSAGTGMKVGQGLHVGAEGLIKVNGYQGTGGNGPDTATNPNVAIGRGSLFQVGSTLTISPLALQSNEVASYLYVHARWRGRWTTNLTAFGGQLLDAVFAYLQVNTDGAGWGTVDQASIEYANQSGSFALDAWHNFPVANSTNHSVQSRLLVAGATVTSSNPQGTLYTEYGGKLEVFY